MSSEKFSAHRVARGAKLPMRPPDFDREIGYGISHEGAIPKKPSREAMFLCQVEWSWSPVHSRTDAYYLHRGRTHWSLWAKYWDDNWEHWEWSALGCVLRQQSSEKEAAVHMLIDFWKFDANEGDVDQFHSIDDVRFLTEEEVTTMAQEVWD